ncbi:MAG TPA: CvpA family protein [Rhodopila sp.]|nr:CvpA family protein [Rhodopila sp.]
MTWVDLAVLGFVAISGLLAFARGFVREILGIGAWVGAAAAAYFGLPVVRGTVAQYVHTPVWVDPISLALVFVVALIVLIFVAHRIGLVVRDSALSGVDRTLGLVFGLARGAVLVCLAYILANVAFPMSYWPNPVRSARTLTPAYDGAAYMRGLLPDSVRQSIRLEAPPSGPEATAEALFHATPQGRATGRPTERE